ncbi:MAG: SMC-Scp complex subunit ScpB [Candidatus Omnitrophota bacterium]|nr:SMC-Scp complex subunit ScpB [Candidatus Omnitrophota bacterium]
MEHSVYRLEIAKIKAIVESLLFVNERPLGLDELASVLELDKKEIESVTEELIGEYAQQASGVCIVKVAGGYQMCSRPDNEPWIKKMYRERSKQKLSVAALETLAIIAYKQPITRMEIESIRGVNIDGVVKHLVDLGLIKTEGRKEVIGRPFLYITTRKFLEYFGLNHLKDLPKLEEFIALAEHEKVTVPDEASGENGSGAERRDHAVGAMNNENETPNKEEVTR